ncbi:MAG: hypothetical protein MUC95_03500 [Spirochaetes bacterium]|nr:hypothetical protein [Spirochaetota bacterium]
MIETRCPGQDLKFFDPDDVFDVVCQKCSCSVEFFKNDFKRACPDCGATVYNEKFDIGCARWCPRAEECLGYDVKALVEENGVTSGEGARLSFADFINRSDKSK